MSLRLQLSNSLQRERERERKRERDLVAFMSKQIALVPRLVKLVSLGELSKLGFTGYLAGTDINYLLIARARATYKLRYVSFCPLDIYSFISSLKKNSDLQAGIWFGSVACPMPCTFLSSRRILFLV